MPIHKIKSKSIKIKASTAVIKAEQISGESKRKLLSLIEIIMTPMICSSPLTLGSDLKATLIFKVLQLRKSPTKISVLSSLTKDVLLLINSLQSLMYSPISTTICSLWNNRQLLLTLLIEIKIRLKYRQLQMV